MNSLREACFVSGWAETQSLPCAYSIYSTPADDSVFAGLDAAYDSGCRDFIGHSLGGMLLLEYALRRPCRRVVLLSTTPCFCGGLGAPESEIRAMGTALSRNRESLLSGFFRRAASPLALPPDVENSLLDGARSFSNEDLSHGLEYLRQTDLSSAISKISIPVLVLHGSLDQIIPVRAAVRLDELMPSAIVRIFPGSGHLLQLENSSEVEQAVAEFFR